MDIFKEIKNLNFPLGEYLIVGSGPLAARGIRDYKDVDILVTENLYNKLIEQDWKTVEIDGVNGRFKVLKNGKFEIDKRLWCGSYKPDTDNLIKSAEIINGVPFLPLKELIKFKRALGREKDLQDIKLIRQHLNEFKEFLKKMPYRKSVGALVFKGNKYLLISFAWQADSYLKMPQGGLHDGETKRQALIRELKEELGTDNFKIIKQFPFSHRYDWDEENARVPGNKYRGQRQTFFLVEFLGTDDDIKIDTKELKAYYWVTKEDFLKKIDINHPMFKGYKKLAEKLLEKAS